jgi:peptidoglycan/xylan/chitin deacetylase (PgdA/CDA1 family)
MTAIDATPRPSRHTTICFHGIGEPSRPLEDGEERFWITPERFLEMMLVIRDHPDYVELTFDDANISDATIALPLLERLGMSAEFFLIAGRIDTPGSLTSEQVRALSHAGMPVGSHGMTHRRWRDVTVPELDFELGRSADILGAITETAIRHASCPGGSYDRRVLSSVKKHGYERVYTVDEGTSKSSSWIRTRYSVIQDDTAESITTLLNRPDESLRSSVIRAGKKTLKRLR